MSIAGRLAKGPAVRWDDLRFPAQGINPAGSAAPPTVDTADYPGSLLFATNATNIIAGIAQLPHGWDYGSEIRPHVHWSKTSSASGGVVWQFRYAMADIGGTFGAYSDWETGTAAVSDSDTAHKHALVAFSGIDMTGIGGSGIVAWQIQRKHDDAADTYAASARLWEFDIHYQARDLGSDTEIPT
jgi:hypothetical protein